MSDWPFDSAVSCVSGTLKSSFMREMSLTVAMGACRDDCPGGYSAQAQITRKGRADDAIADCGAHLLGGGGGSIGGGGLQIEAGAGSKTALAQLLDAVELLRGFAGAGLCACEFGNFLRLGEARNHFAAPDIAAGVARSLGLEPRVAFVSFSTFGYPVSERAIKMHEAPRALDAMQVDFEYEGEMTVDVALNPQALAHYPFCRLSGPANILVVPARHSASISVKLMQEMAGATVIGPILTGVPKPIQICSTNSTVNDILNMAVMAACKIG